TTFVGATNFQQGSFQEFTFEQANLGTIEDIEGHTLFGPNGDYIGFSSGFRPNGTGAFVTNQPGFETFVSPTTSTFIDAAEGIVTFATNDPNLMSVVADPLPLAGITASRASTPGQFDSVFATGFAVCSANRSCGANNSKLYALTPNFFGGDQSTAGNIEFQQGANDDNTVIMSFQLSDNGQGGFGNQNNLISLQPGQDETTYISDDRFGAGSTNTNSQLNGNAFNASVAVASANSIQELGQIVPSDGTNSDPNFARWGFFSAQLPVTQANGFSDVDIVPLGTWVAGVRPDAADYALLNVQLGFAGLAIGNTADLGTGDLRTTAGNFAMTFDFASRTGTFNLNLPDAGISQQLSVTGAADRTIPTFTGTNFSSGVNTSVDGAFFAGAGQPVAATGGVFDVQDTIANQQTVGIFVGDVVP
ncbi:MAG: hypothetical protein AAF568_02940, partial [Pseudomonadota bacterium]